MLRLIKYELQKQKVSKIIIGAFFLVMELLFLFGIITKNIDICGVAAAMLVLLSVIALIYVSVEAILTYDKDMKEKSGYMLFMVPQSEYTILGSKILTSVITLFVMTVGIVLLGFGDLFLMGARFEGLMNSLEMVLQLLSQLFHAQVDAALIVTYIFMFLFNWIEILASAFLAITIVHTVLKQIKGKGIITFIIFVCINMIVSKMSDWIFSLMGINQNVVDVNASGADVMVQLTAETLQPSLFATLILSAVFAAICLWACGFMLKKKLSL